MGSVQLRPARLVQRLLTGSHGELPEHPRWQAGEVALDSVQHHPIPAAQVAAHFDAAYLATLPAPAATTLNASFAGRRALAARQGDVSTPESIGFVVTSTGRASSR